MEDYYEYLDSNGVTTLYKLIKDDTVALIDSYSVTLNGITTTLDTHINDSDIHTPITDIENMIGTAIGNLNYATPDYVDTKISGLVNSAPETLDTLKELSDALGNDTNFATTIVNQIGTKAAKDSVYTKQETDTLLEGKANSVHSHVVSNITDFPTIPTKLSQLENDMGFGTGGGSGDTSISWTNITDKPNFSTVAISGSYNDLVDTPNIPTKTSDLTNDSGYITSVSWGDITSKPVLSQVAISGSYSDLSGTPTIPTKTSQLINDSGFLTSSSGVITSVSWSDITNKPNFSTVATSGSYTDLSNTPNIPTKLSDLSNDSGFAIDNKVVHKTGNETIEGFKTFSNTIHRSADLTTSGGEQVYRFDDINANGCGHIYNNAHWHDNSVFNRYGAYNAKSGKAMEIDIISSDDGSGVVFVTGTATNRNLADATSATGYSAIATMGWVNNPATSTNVVHRSGDETIAGVKTFIDAVHSTTVNAFMAQYGGYTCTLRNDGSHTYLLMSDKDGVPGTWSTARPLTIHNATGTCNISGNANSATYATTQATSDNSTKIATTAWVRNYVNSVVGYSAVGSSISAYYSNAAIVTAIGTDTSNTAVYPADFSNYIDISPKVGTIYTGSQLFSALTPTASGTIKKDYTSSGTPIYNTTAKATATFSGAFSASAKYLCTTANAVKFRVYVDLGTPSSMGAASIVDQSISKSIFIRVE